MLDADTGDRSTSPLATRDAVRAAVVLTVATGLNAAGNIVFHAFVARGGGVTNYGAVGALLSFGTIASTLATGVQFAVARTTSVTDTGARTLLHRGMWAASPWLLLCVLCAAAGAPLATYLRLDSTVPVILALSYFAALVAYSVPAGILIGRRRFGTFAALTGLSVVLRLVYGMVLGWQSDNGVSALASTVLAIVTVGLLAVVILAHDDSRRRIGAGGHAPLPGRAALTGEGVTGSVLSASLWAAWTLPVLFARHYLSDSEAGDFAAVQLVVSGVLFLTSGLTTAFYPAIARGRQLRDVVTGLAATVAMSTVCVAGADLLGPSLLHHLYGARFDVSAELFLVMGASVIAIATLTFVLWVVQALQQHVASAATGILAAFVAEAMAGVVWHGSAVALAAGPGLASVFGSGAGLIHHRVQRRRAAAGHHGSLAYALPPQRLMGREFAGSLLGLTTVGVMAHNEVNTIEPCLDAILNERDGVDGVSSVVVVVSGSTDGTDDAVRRVAARDGRVRLLVEDRLNGKVAAVNWFLRETHEPICALVSADTLLAPGALSWLVQPFAGGRVGMTGGRVVPTNARRGLVGRVVHVLWDMHHHVALRQPKLGETVAFRRVLDQLDTHSLVDEVSIEERVTEVGLALRYVPDAIVFNHGPATVSDYVAQRRRIHHGHLGVRHSTGYTPSTMRTGLLVSTVGRAVLRRPTSLPPLLAAMGLEVVARLHAQTAFRGVAETMHGGVWKPISSAKQTFSVDLVPVGPVTGHVAPRHEAQAMIEEAV